MPIALFLLLDFLNVFLDKNRILGKSHISYPYPSTYVSHTVFVRISTQQQTLTVLLVTARRQFIRYRLKWKPPLDSRTRARIFDHTPNQHSTPFYKVCDVILAAFVKRCLFTFTPFIIFIAPRRIRGPPVVTDLEKSSHIHRRSK